MDTNTKFNWPNDDAECAVLARSTFIKECVRNARYWLAYGSHFITHAQPQAPFLRAWSDIAKQDKAYRDVFATMTDVQKSKVIELLEHCIRGVVHSTLVTLDQFPHGEAEVCIWDGVCGDGKRRFRIAPGPDDLHHDFSAAFHAKNEA